MQFHPDKVADDEKEEAEAKFVKVSEAYAILSDEKKREVYDKYGKNGLDMLERGMDPEAAGFGGGGFGGPGGGGFGGGFPGGGNFHFQQGGFPGGGNFHFQQGSGGHSFGGFDPFSMFADMFGEEFGGAGGGGGRGPGGFNFGGGSADGGFQQQGRQEDIFPKNSKTIIKLGSPKFPDESSKYLWLVVFYTNQGSGSRDAKPQLEQLAEKVKGTYKFGAVDCSKSQKEQQFCEKMGATANELPKFAFVVDGKPIWYERGDRVPSAKQLHEFVTENLPVERIQNVNNSPHIQERLLDALLSKKKHKAAILLLSEKYETSSMYASLAYEYRDSFIFGESRAKNLNMAKEFNVKKYPLLLALVPKGKGDEKYNDQADLILYRGPVSKNDISKWLSSLSGEQPQTKKRKRQSSGARDEF